MRSPFIIILLLATSTTTMAQPAPSRPASPDPASISTGPPTAETSWQLAVEPRLGLVVPTAKLGPMVIGGIEVDYAVAMDKRLLVGLDVSLTRPSHDGTVMDPRVPSSPQYAIKETEMVLALLASYRFAAQDRALVPWVGAGPMLHFLRSTETTTIAPGDNTAGSTELGLELAGGADYRVGPGFIVGDVRFAYTKLEHTITGSTNAGKITLALGYRFVF